MSLLIYPLNYLSVCVLHIKTLYVGTRPAFSLMEKVGKEERVFVRDGGSAPGRVFCSAMLADGCKDCLER